MINEAKAEVRDRLADMIGTEAADTFMKSSYDAFSKFSCAATYGR